LLALHISNPLWALLLVLALFSPSAAVCYLASFRVVSRIRCCFALRSWQHQHKLLTHILATSMFAVPPNYAFKPTAGEVCRSNRPLPAGGGLTRR
jgi:hypothetical protein